jgi:hypothetical protein
LRGHTLEVGERLRDAATIAPTAAAPTIDLSLDSTFVRSCEDGERHLEVRIGNVETPDGGRPAGVRRRGADRDRHRGADPPES